MTVAAFPVKSTGTRRSTTYWSGPIAPLRIASRHAGENEVSASDLYLHDVFKADRNRARSAFRQSGINGTRTRVVASITSNNQVKVSESGPLSNLKDDSHGKVPLSVQNSLDDMETSSGVSLRDYATPSAISRQASTFNKSNKSTCEDCKKDQKRTYGRPAKIKGLQRLMLYLS